MEKLYFTLLLVSTLFLSHAQIAIDYNFTQDVSAACNSSYTELVHWELYQTQNDRWDGIQIPVCTDFGFVGQNHGAKIDFLNIDRTKTIFVRENRRDNYALAKNAVYRINFHYRLANSGGLDTAHLTEGVKTTTAMVKILSKDSLGNDTIAHWYYGQDMGNNFQVCAVTENYSDTSWIDEIIWRIKPETTGLPGNVLYLDAVICNEEISIQGTAPLSQSNLENYYYPGNNRYILATQNPVSGLFAANFLVKQDSTSQPSDSNITYLEIGPVPNVSNKDTVDVDVGGVLLFQPHTNLRGLQVLGDTVRHCYNLNLTDHGMMCLEPWYDVKFEAGDGLSYSGGTLIFGGQKSCFRFNSGSRLRIKSRAHLNYGTRNMGMLALESGMAIEIESGGTLAINNTIVLLPSGTQREVETVLERGTSLTFKKGSKIIDPKTNDEMVWKIRLRGGDIDLSQLDMDSRKRILLIYEQTSNDWQDALTLTSNLIDNEVEFVYSKEEAFTGLVRIVNVNGQLLQEIETEVVYGTNRFNIRSFTGQAILQFIHQDGTTLGTHKILFRKT